MTDPIGANAIGGTPGQGVEEGVFGFSRPAADPREVAFFHRSDDVDQHDGAHHHTLGRRRGQAARGLDLAKVEEDVGQLQGDVGQLQEEVEDIGDRVTDLETLSIQGIVPSSVVVGSGSASVAPDGTVTFTGVSSLSLNGVFDGLGADLYAYYLVASTSVDSSNILARFRASGADNSSSIYSASFHGALNGSAWVGQAPLNSLTAMYAGYGRAPGALNGPSFAAGHIVKPRSTASGKSLLIDMYAPQYIEGSMGSYANTLTAFDGITFVPSSGTMTGTLKLVKIA